MPELYLIGGGWEESSFRKTFGRFVSASTRNGDCKILLILASKDPIARVEVAEEFKNVFCRYGNVEVNYFFIEEENLLTTEDLSRLEPTSVFVGGGLTPRYQELLCRGRVLENYIALKNIPYGGFSAGSAICSKAAIVGGWKIKKNNVELKILDEEFSEDLEFVEIREGLGLIDFPIDVHGSQWGTISRVIHALDQNCFRKGMVIDESTMVECKDSKMTVYGSGSVYLIRKDTSNIEIFIFNDGDNIQL